MTLFDRQMKAKYPHHFADAIKPRHVQKSDIGSIYFYNNCIVGEFNEGVTVSYKTGFNLLLNCLKHIGAQPFYLISNRVNSYAVQPTDYKYLEKVPNLKGIAIVTLDDFGLTNAKLEAKFFKKEFEVFKNLDAAKAWGDNLIKSYSV